MVRIVIIVLVLWVIVRIARSLLRARRNSPAAEHTLTRCDYCGLHVPSEEAIRDNGRSYCCEEHRQAGMARRE